MRRRGRKKDLEERKEEEQMEERLQRAVRAAWL